MKKKILFCLLVVLCGHWAHAQDSSHHEYRKRYVLWFTPSHINEINGVALGIFNNPHLFDEDSVKIRGINIGVDPLVIFAAPYAVMLGLFSPVTLKDTTKYNRNVRLDMADIEPSLVKISGLNLSPLGTLIGGDQTRINGLSLAGVVLLVNELNGCSIACGVNRVNTFNGMMIAPIQNKVLKGNGLQIGLFNYCEDCRGVQIGLLNKMGKRVTPFINMQFGKRKR